MHSAMVGPSHGPWACASPVTLGWETTNAKARNGTIDRTIIRQTNIGYSLL
jgi:hypothetical protein